MYRLKKHRSIGALSRSRDLFLQYNQLTLCLGARLLIRGGTVAPLRPRTAWTGCSRAAVVRRTLVRGQSQDLFSQAMLSGRRRQSFGGAQIAAAQCQLVGVSVIQAVQYYNVFS